MEEKQTEKNSIFKITAIVLSVLLIVAIIVQIIVLVVIKNKTEKLKNKNDNLPSIAQTQEEMLIEDAEYLLCKM